MAIVYRLQKGSRLTVEDMDGNFQHVENYLTGLTASVNTLTTNLLSATASISTLQSDVIDLQNALTGVTGDFNFLLLVGGVTQSGTFSFVDGILGTYSI